MHYRSEIERADDGMEAFFDDMQKWWKEHKSKCVEKTRDLFSIVVVVGAMICFIIGIIWILTHLPW